MRFRWKGLFTSQVNAVAPWDRWDFVALALAVVTTLWVFALKLKTFYDLGYSGDLFVSVQAARSWLEGKGVLHDNCFGNILAIHTYFMLVPLGVIAKPFGAPGTLREGSTDSNVPMNIGIPAVTIGGGGAGSEAHSLNETFNTRDSYLGTQRGLLLAVALAR